MKEIIINNAVKKDKNYRYFIDRNGNLVKEKYQYLKDPYTWITLIIIVIAFLYFTETQACRTTLSHLDVTCKYYCNNGTLPGGETGSNELAYLKINKTLLSNETT